MFKVGDTVLVGEGRDCIYKGLPRFWTPLMSKYMKGKMFKIIFINDDRYYLDVDHVPELKGSNWYVIAPWIEPVRSKHYKGSRTNIPK